MILFIRNKISRLQILSARLLLIIGAIAIPSLSVQAQVNAEQVLAIGRNVLSMEDYMLSIHYFNQAIKAKPYLADPYFFRAIAKLSLDDFKGAEEDCTLALERNKFKTEAYKVRGFARMNMGNDSLAIADYNIGLTHNPFDKYFLFYKGVALTELEKYDSADSTFTALLKRYPSFDEGFSARGRMNVARGDTTAALADIDRAIEITKSAVNPYLLRAQIEWDRKEWDKAGADMDAAIRLHPEVPNLYVNRAFIRYNSDDFFGAMSDYNYTLELDPKNTAALFNRALLRYEVKDLEKSENDLSQVLSLDPGNFHAIYNRGLVRLEQNKNLEALADFQQIAAKYPRFYPVYYAIAETHRNMGDMKKAMQNAHTADELVQKYVKNPEKNPLDRPAIAAAETNDVTSRFSDDESETEVMERFNRLVTVSDAVETQLSYNEKIKGRVQDRNVNVDIEPLYAISLSSGPASLKAVSNYFRELDDLNQQRLINRRFYLSPGLNITNEGEVEALFSLSSDLENLIKEGKGRPVDRLALGVAQGMLKNFQDAIVNLDEAIKIDPRFTVAYMARAFINFARMKAEERNAMAESDETKGALGRRIATANLQDVIADYDKALTLNPRLVYAWFNKGDIYYSVGDYTSALQCYSEAIKTDPEFGQAYFNRGLTYLQAGNKHQAFADLSKAGELGVLPSYNILKRMK